MVSRLTSYAPSVLEPTIEASPCVVAILSAAIPLLWSAWAANPETLMSEGSLPLNVASVMRELENKLNATISRLHELKSASNQQPHVSVLQAHKVLDHPPRRWLVRPLTPMCWQLPHPPRFDTASAGQRLILTFLDAELTQGQGQKLLSSRLLQVLANIFLSGPLKILLDIQNLLRTLRSPKANTEHCGDISQH